MINLINFWCTPVSVFYVKRIWPPLIYYLSTKSTTESKQCRNTCMCIKLEGETGSSCSSRRSNSELSLQDPDAQLDDVVPGRRWPTRVGKLNSPQQRKRFVLFTLFLIPIPLYMTFLSLCWNGSDLTSLRLTFPRLRLNLSEFRVLASHVCGMSV